MTSDNFISFLKKENISIDKDKLDKFQKFLFLLIEENKKTNLTSIVEKDEIYEKHFFDSLSPFFKKKIIIDEGKKILDIGTGGGFPSIPIKIVFPNLELTALDSVTKKVNFVSYASKKILLENFNVSNERAEIFSRKNEEKFDFIFSRATGPISVVLEIGIRALKVGGKFILWKGKNVDFDIEEAKEAEKILGLKLVEKQSVILPTSNVKRYNLIYIKERKTPNLFPREFKKIKKEML